MMLEPEEMLKYITVDSGYSVYNGTDGSNTIFFADSGRTCTRKDYARSDYTDEQINVYM